MLIGREEEIKLLQEAYDSAESEFVAIYGRRRIGKTYLVRETLQDKFTFSHSGVAKLPARKQLHAFYNSLVEQGYKPSQMPTNWLDAFHYLSMCLAERSEPKKVIFLDELPWMDTHKSDFLPASNTSGTIGLRQEKTFCLSSVGLPLLGSSIRLSIITEAFTIVSLIASS